MGASTECAGIGVLVLWLALALCVCVWAVVGELVVVAGVVVGAIFAHGDAVLSARVGVVMSAIVVGTNNVVVVLWWVGPFSFVLLCCMILDIYECKRRE